MPTQSSSKGLHNRSATVVLPQSGQITTYVDPCHVPLHNIIGLTSYPEGTAQNDNTYTLEPAPLHNTTSSDS